MKYKVLILTFGVWFLVCQSCGSVVSTQSNKIEKAHNEALSQTPILLNSEDWKFLQQNPQVYKDIVDKANANLDYQTRAVVDFSPDPHYTKTGLNTSENNGGNFSNDARMAYTQAVAYLVTQEVKYAKTAQRIIDTWAKTLKSVGSEQGKATINFNAPYFFVAANWVKDVNHWNHQTADLFFKQIILPQTSRATNGNHGLWAILMEATAAQYFQDKTLMNSARKRWEELLQNIVAEDGSMPYEIQRSGTSNWVGGPDKGKKGMAYNHYALLPASLAAKVFADNHMPVWHSKGGKRLEKAYNQAVEWTAYPERFPYYQSNNGDLIGVDNAAYFILLQRYYPNPTAQQLIQNKTLGMNAFYLKELYSK